MGRRDYYGYRVKASTDTIMIIGIIAYGRRLHDCRTDELIRNNQAFKDAVTKGEMQ